MSRDGHDSSDEGSKAMQAFTSGDVTVRVEISNMQPQVGNMMIGYYCEFVWWLEVDGVEYVSGETAWHEDWHTSNGDGFEGWDAEVVSDRITSDDVPIDDDIDAVAGRVLDWFANLREDIVGSWMNTVTEYVERANEYGDGRTDIDTSRHYSAEMIGVSVETAQPAWAIVDETGRVEPGVWYDSKAEAVAAISAMRHV